MTKQRYQDLRSAELGLLATADAGALVRVIAGEVAGHRGPGSTHTPMALVHASPEPGARLDLPWPVDDNALVYVLAGRGSVGLDRSPIGTGQLAVLGSGDELTLTAAARQESRAPHLEVLVLGELPIREPIAWAGPFVVNTKAEVREAYDDFQRGRMGQIRAVHAAPSQIVEG